ncbi:MAG: hypothetical protein LUD07_07845 [Clostridiales bacterium]|nr:hypothetical protein [Clostridiales bacterium]
MIIYLDSIRSWFPLTAILTGVGIAAIVFGMTTMGCNEIYPAIFLLIGSWLVLSAVAVLCRKCIIPMKNKWLIIIIRNAGDEQTATGETS